MGDVDHKFFGGLCLLQAKEKDSKDPTIYYSFKMEPNDPQTIYYNIKKHKEEEKLKYGYISSQKRTKKYKYKSLSKKYICPKNITPLPASVINSKISYKKQIYVDQDSDENRGS